MTIVYTFEEKEITQAIKEYLNNRDIYPDSVAIVVEEKPSKEDYWKTEQHITIEAKFQKSIDEVL